MWQGDPALGTFQHWNGVSGSFPLPEDIGTLNAPGTDSCHPRVSNHEYLKVALPCQAEALAGEPASTHSLAEGPCGVQASLRPGAACPPPNQTLALLPSLPLSALQ